jgi:hypothetical protein
VHAPAQEWLSKANIPETRRHTTRRGGFHFLFRAHPSFGNSEGKIAKGVDTRGLREDGKPAGYIIDWSSHGFPVQHADVLADVPAWLLTALTAALRKPKPTTSPHVARFLDSAAGVDRLLDYILGDVMQAPQGERNATLFKKARRIVGMHSRGELSDINNAAELLVDALRAGLSDDEARRCVFGTIERYSQ